ncbi:hypothetical protein BZA77DRAFT_384588 [Pyronema omphalodes]|nr:hypothetical protein BZA77DRAFT_384588 [Pyronema omphalodes]
MPTSSTWRSPRDLAGGLFSGIFLLLTSLFGPFVLRTIERRRLAAPPPTVIVGAKSEPSPAKIPESAVKPSPEPIQNEIPAEHPNPNLYTVPPPELSHFMEFASQFPAPACMLPRPGLDTTGPQRIYKDTVNGQNRMVMEQQHYFGDGRRVRRKLVVYERV